MSRPERPNPSWWEQGPAPARWPDRSAPQAPSATFWLAAVAILLALATVVGPGLAWLARGAPSVHPVERPVSP